MFSLLKTYSSDGLKKLIFAISPIFIEDSFMLNIVPFEVKISITFSVSNMLFKIPKALSSPILPYCA